MNQFIIAWEVLRTDLGYFVRSHLPGTLEAMSERLYAEIEANRPKPVQGMEPVPYAELEVA